MFPLLLMFSKRTHTLFVRFATTEAIFPLLASEIMGESSLIAFSTSLALALHIIYVVAQTETSGTRCTVIVYTYVWQMTTCHARNRKPSMNEIEPWAYAHAYVNCLRFQVNQLVRSFVSMATVGRKYKLRCARSMPNILVDLR